MTDKKLSSALADALRLPPGDASCREEADKRLKEEWSLLRTAMVKYHVETALDEAIERELSRIHAIAGSVGFVVKAPVETARDEATDFMFRVAHNVARQVGYKRLNEMPHALQITIDDAIMARLYND